MKREDLEIDDLVRWRRKSEWSDKYYNHEWYIIGFIDDGVRLHIGSHTEWAPFDDILYVVRPSIRREMKK